ncbi:MAG: TRAP transporter small permease [Bosea sp. (in: a-proteobacteria)]|uniref:TRAP transporter small permease n=1 Tax=Methylobacterium sp. CCH7-A2 TaxID=1768789 RepID=UPI00082F276F|nr:TRAP transporter small permease [Methylobacterium sp. CCH7-A2]MDX3805030.1 TRAP transporter small permease [Bosea sp. (in: a-proteobacteria)]
MSLSRGRTLIVPRIVDATLEAINRWLVAATAALILGMAVVITTDVLGRNLFDRPVPWSAELSEYGLYLSAVLIAPWLLRRGQHISIGIIIDALPVRAAGPIVKAGDILCAAVSAILAWYALQATLRSHSDGSLIIKNVIFPEWYVFVPLTAVFALMTVEFLVQFVRGSLDDARGPG